MYTFGPVPSRRLGRSLGINNIPPKYCSYACVYCQLGRAIRLISSPEEFYLPELIYKEVEKKLKILSETGVNPDYLTIVADGEPTLDIHLGKLIKLLQRTSVPVAVITNGTLLYLPQIRAALSESDWVSVKVDSVDESAWRRVDRPAKNVRLPEVLSGIESFATDYKGILVTETMLVDGCNTSTDNLEKTAVYISGLNPECAYLSAPVRPPAEPWVVIPSPEVCNRAYQIFTARIERVEYLLGYEGNTFANTGDPLEDILSITAVHPMREDALEMFLKRKGADLSLVNELIRQEKLKCTLYGGEKFYARVLRRS
jgi:wyosine [tRNA(Phe)-imidazoG37] synthetase (radical SAM superfamily)